MHMAASTSIMIIIMFIIYDFCIAIDMYVTKTLQLKLDYSCTHTDSVSH